jgi:NAD(P)-dependent dehydrogenase (short-subunit alcohol dehydrogenase family)
MAPRPVAAITGGSRGIGAATARELAARGFDVSFTFRNKAARADEVAAEVERAGGAALAARCDMTDPSALRDYAARLAEWRVPLALLVLNASGGLERDLVAADPDYPMRINHDAQLAMLAALLPLFAPSATVIHVTSHWAHLFGTVPQLPDYEPVARSKHAGEAALRARIPDLAQRGIRLIVVTGDLVEGTITARLLERRTRGLSDARALDSVTPEVFASAIADAALDRVLVSGATVVVGGALASVPRG